MPAPCHTGTAGHMQAATHHGLVLGPGLRGTAHCSKKSFWAASGSQDAACCPLPVPCGEDKVADTSMGKESTRRMLSAACSPTARLGTLLRWRGYLLLLLLGQGHSRDLGTL